MLGNYKKNGEYGGDTHGAKVAAHGKERCTFLLIKIYILLHVVVVHFLS